jgi:LL-diaminopimelate aminotransferase
MRTAKRLEGIGEYYFSQKLREIEAMNAAGKKVINLGIGSPDMPPHPDVIKILQAESAKNNTHAYQSYKGSPVLRNAVAQWYQEQYSTTLDPATEILPMIGSKEGIMHLCMTYLDEGDHVLIPDPGYPTYRSAAKLAGANCIAYDLVAANEWLPDLEQLSRQVKAAGNVKLMFVNYPHMPTGKLPTEAFFKELVAFAKAHAILLVHDNPYSFILNDAPMSLLRIEGAKEVAVELNSLSKSHNMAGWRIGVLCGAQQRIDEVLRFKSNMDSGMFLPVQLAAAAALGLGVDWYAQVNKTYRERKNKVYELLEALDCSFDKDQAGLFVWAAVPPGYKDGYALSDEVLQEAQVFVTPGGIFGANGNGYVRISLCATEEKIGEAIAAVKAMKVKLTA